MAFRAGFLMSSHRALDRVCEFVDIAELRALRLLCVEFRTSRVLTGVRRVFERRLRPKSTSKRAKRRLEAVDAFGRVLGLDAVDFLRRAFCGDRLQVVRAAAVEWLARLARRAGPGALGASIYDVAADRYESHELNTMNVRRAIEDHFIDAFDNAFLRSEFPDRALTAYVLAHRDEIEAKRRKAREAAAAAAAGLMGGRLELYRDDGAGGRARVNFRVARDRQLVALSFRNPTDKVVELREYWGTGLRRLAGERLSFLLEPGETLQFSYLDVVESYRPPRDGHGHGHAPPGFHGPHGLGAHLLHAAGGGGAYHPPGLGAFPYADSSDDEWIAPGLDHVHREVPFEPGAHRHSRDYVWIVRTATNSIIVRGSGTLKLEARDADAGEADDGGAVPPFELWTFAVRAADFSCRVDPIVGVHITAFGYNPTPGKMPFGYVRRSLFFFFDGVRVASSLTGAHRCSRSKSLWRKSLWSS